MTLSLYGLGPSRSFRCLWALHEAKLEHKYIALSFGSQESAGLQSPNYKSINSQGKVPTLVDGDFVLTESAAILNYIDSLTTKQFIPTNEQSRAKYDELCFFILSELEQPLWTTGKHRFALPEEQRVAAIFSTAKWEFAKALSSLENQFSIDEFALGDTFSFADILLAHTFNWADRFEFELPTTYLEYRDRLYSRAACLAATQETKHK